MSDGKKHSLLSPSSSERWMRCHPSARLTENYPNTTSSYASEGTAYHDCAEKKLKHRLGMAKKPKKCTDAEMDGYTDDYVLFVMEQAEGLENPTVYVEQKVDCSRWIPKCCGTCDAIILSDGVLHVIDLKAGRGVKVAADAEQLRIYALGALEMFGFLYEIHTIRLSVYQPRINNCGTWEVSREDLEHWADEILKPAAEMAWKGEGVYVAGTHCQFCKAKAECRERARANQELAAYDFIDPPLLSTDEIVVILGKVDRLVAWASDIKDFALVEALRGVKFEGWKIVEGRSNRRYTNEDAVASAVKEIGLDPYKHELLGITAMTSLLGKKRFEDTLGRLIEKPIGKPVMVQSTDKRQEMNLNTAADDFADPIEN